MIGVALLNDGKRFVPLYKSVYARHRHHMVVIVCCREDLYDLASIRVETKILPDSSALNTR